MRFTDNQIQYKVKVMLKNSGRSDGYDEERRFNSITLPRVETETQSQGSIKEQETRQKELYK